MINQPTKLIRKNIFIKTPNKNKKYVKALSLLMLAVFIIGNLPTFKVSAAATITGTVYYDFNGNGANNTGSATLANDRGVSGVVVTAYDSTGAATGTTTSGANGTYSLSATGTGTGGYRIEFTSLPAGYSPSASGTNNGTTVQFVPNANTAGVDLGIVNNTIYSQDNPNLVTSMQVSGNPLGGGTSGTSAWMAVFPYDSSVATAIPLTYTGTVLGATWGQAYQRSTRKLFSSALVKRHVGLGSFSTDGSNGAGPLTGGNSGTGGIYVTDFSVPGSTPAQFVNLQNLGITTGSFAAARSLPAVAATPSADAEAFGLVGKTGIGDIDLSEDGNTLWAVNLNTRSLVRMDVTGGAVPSSATEFPISAISGIPTCTNGVLRPWGLAFRNSLGYLGAVCSAENAGGTAANLVGYVLSFNPASPTAFTTVLNIPLNYTRGMATGRATGANVWFPWTDTYSDAAFRPGTINDSGAGGTVVSRPTPILSDIEFDNNGSMTIGFIDRAGDQIGDGHPRPDGTGILAPASGGEILRAQSNGAGGYVLESNASVTGFTGSGVGNTQGPGGGEFYSNDTFNAPDHNETAQGGLAQLYGGNIATTETDPVDYRNGGVGWMNNTNGANPRDYRLFAGAIPNFGKANGLGDLELLSNAAPIEVGNRVWMDTNANGIQDAGEPGIANVMVELYKGGVPATYARYRDEFTAVSSYTGTNGSVNWAGTPWTEIGEADGAGAGNVMVAASGTNLGNVVSINAVSKGLDRVISLTGSSSATLSYNYQRSGMSFIVDYSLDGTTYTPLQTLAAGTDAAVQSASFTIPVGATHIRFRSNTTTSGSNLVVFDNVQVTTNAVAKTDANGNYYFSSELSTPTPNGASIVYGANLLPNMAYQVRIPASNFTTGQPLASKVASPVDNDGSSNGDSRDSDGNIFGGGIVAANFTTGAAGSNNHTFDFGFRAAPPTAANVTIGGRAVSPSGSGLRGVMVNLTQSDGTTRTALTNSFGYYRFDEIAAGQTVTVSVTSKRYTFSQPTQVLNVSDNIADLNFVSENR